MPVMNPVGQEDSTPGGFVELTSCHLEPRKAWEGIRRWSVISSAAVSAAESNCLPDCTHADH